MMHCLMVKCLIIEKDKNQNNIKKLIFILKENFRRLYDVLSKKKKKKRTDTKPFAMVLELFLAF